MSTIVYRLRMQDGSFVTRITEVQARAYLVGDGWTGVMNGLQYITAARPDPTLHELRVVGFDASGPQCVHPTYGSVRVYEPVES